MDINDAMCEIYSELAYVYLDGLELKEGVKHLEEAKEKLDTFIERIADDED